MKILIITELLAPYRVVWFDELGKNADVTVLYTKERDKSRNDKWLANKPNNCKYKLLKSINIFNYNVSLNVIKELKKDYDIILLDGYGFLTQMIAIIYLKFTKKEFFMNIDGGIPRKKENKFIGIIKRVFINSPTYYLSSGSTTNKYLQFYGVSNIKNIFHHNFSSLLEKDILRHNLTNEYKAILKENLGLENKPTAIAVGQFIRRKGFDILIESWRKVDNDYNLLIIGGGEKEIEYKKQIKENGLKNIKIMNFVQPEILKKYYMACDLFILPTREDIWGLVINEAMACGLPVITTDKCVAGIELIEDNKNGFIVKTEDYESLANKVNKILSDYKLMKYMGDNNLIKIKEYTIENMAQKHISIFNKVAKNN